MQISFDTSDRFTEALQFPFKSIKIEDVRFDTTLIGIYSTLNNMFIPSIRNYKINFKTGVSSSLHLYLNNFFQKNLSREDIELVCFLKKLCLTKRDTFTENKSLYRTFGQVSFQTEVFLRSGKDFYTAFRIDTILITSVGVKKKVIIDDLRDYLLVPALKILQYKISNTAWDKVIKKKSFSESMVYENYFNNRFSLPVLTQPYKKGIYQTFSEFKNNAPSTADFTVKKGKSRTVSLIDKNGNYLVTTKMFGFCDGERCWILGGNFCYPLLRAGNSFEFFFTLVNNLKVLLAVDMDTGNFY